jgi:hypothetical protein
LLAGWALGGSRPRRPDYLACLGILGGLAVFFALIGDPGKAAPLAARAGFIAIVVALGAGLAACLSVRRGTVPVRAAIYGGVAGGWFGLVGVLLNAAATVWRDQGLAGFGHAEGLVPLIGLLVIGGVGITLTQISFQVGALGASFPANKAADPVVAVVLGAALLREHVPAGPAYIVGYLACLGVIVAGTTALANRSTAPATDLSHPRRAPVRPE